MESGFDCYCNRESQMYWQNPPLRNLEGEFVVLGSQISMHSDISAGVNLCVYPVQCDRHHLFLRMEYEP
jgi:hypothetical protein